MQDEISYNKNSLDEALKKLGKEIRRLGGKEIRAEITIVGGAAIIAGNTFRESTTDIDAIFRAPSLIKDAINNVAEQNGFTKGWINQDFKNTESYSPKIEQYSVYYRTFSNVLQVRILPPEYIAAMKLAALREYKHDKSDIVGLIHDNKLTKKQIDHAYCNLYQGYDMKENGKEAKEFLDRIFQEKDLEKLYKVIQEEERDSKEILRNIEENYPNVLKQDTVNDVLKQAIVARDRKIRKRIEELSIKLKNNAKMATEFDKDLGTAINETANFYDSILEMKNLSWQMVDDAASAFIKDKEESLTASELLSSLKTLKDEQYSYEYQNER